MIWDDHEVENNYAGDHSEDADVPEAEFQARRAAAYQAWWEHQAVRLPAPESADYQIYRSFSLGSLAQLFLLDGRQYRSDQSCGDQVLVLEPPCPETFAPGRTMLGDEQERWLLDGLAASPTTWNIVGNQTILSDLTLNGAILNYDQWDGYPEARQRLLYGIDQTGLTNVVTLTGDIHAAGVIDLVVEDENGSHPVGTELITSSVSSTTNLPVGAEAILAQFPGRPLRRRHQARMGAQRDHPRRLEGRVPGRRRRDAGRLADHQRGHVPDRPGHPRRPDRLSAARPLRSSAPRRGGRRRRRACP